MNAYLESKSPRERAALGIGLFVAVTTGVFMLVTEPGEARLQRSRAQLASAAAAHDQLLVIASEAAAIAQASAASTGAALPRETLLSVIDASAQAAGIREAVKRLAPAAGDEVSVVLEGVAFDALMTWLASLYADYGLDIEQFTANPGTHSGSVNVSLVLSREGGAA